MRIPWSHLHTSFHGDGSPVLFCCRSPGFNLADVHSSPVFFLVTPHFSQDLKKCLRNHRRHGIFASFYNPPIQEDLSNVLHKSDFETKIVTAGLKFILLLAQLWFAFVWEYKKMISGEGVKNKMTDNRKGNARKATREQSISNTSHQTTCHTPENGRFLYGFQ